MPAAFTDAAPDRWGRTLMERREAASAREDRRPTRTLDDWDFLLGVDDTTRMGALRLARPDDGSFIDDERPEVPPMARLRELEHAARELERPSAESRPGELDWLHLLLAPGSSLGGARPKSNVLDEDGTAWIAKFPSRADRHDVGAWESVVATLAGSAGITVADHRLLDLDGEFRTFATRRFDRTPTGRRAYASAMTLVGKHDGEPASYLDIALAIADHVAPRRDRDRTSSSSSGESPSTSSSRTATTTSGTTGSCGRPTAGGWPRPSTSTRAPAAPSTPSRSTEPSERRISTSWWRRHPSTASRQDAPRPSSTRSVASWLVGVKPRGQSGSPYGLQPNVAPRHLVSESS